MGKLLLIVVVWACMACGVYLVTFLTEHRIVLFGLYALIAFLSIVFGIALIEEIHRLLLRKVRLHSYPYRWGRYILKRFGLFRKRRKPKEAGAKEDQGVADGAAAAQAAKELEK